MAFCQRTSIFMNKPEKRANKPSLSMFFRENGEIRLYPSAVRGVFLSQKPDNVKQNPRKKRFFFYSEPYPASAARKFGLFFCIIRHFLAQKQAFAVLRGLDRADIPLCNIAPHAIRASDHMIALRRGGRVVECTALEMRHRGNPIGSSNLPLSARYFK